MPSAVEFDEAVDLQRGLIDFDKLKKRKTKGGTKKKGKKKVTKAQQQKLLELILQWQVKEATS